MKWKHPEKLYPTHPQKTYNAHSKLVAYHESACEGQTEKRHMVWKSKGRRRRKDKKQRSRKGEMKRGKGRGVRGNDPSLNR